jgi:hypothetical protein
MNNNYEKIEEAITKEITAAQLSGSKHKFKCSVCGSRHSTGSTKTLQKCLSKFQYTQNPYIENYFFNDYKQQLNVKYVQAKINVILPGISLYSLYNKPDKISEFLQDYYKMIRRFDDENISIDNNCIFYNYNDKLSKQYPYLFLVENYNDYIAYQYKKTFKEKIPKIKAVLLYIAQVFTKYSDIFIEQNQFGIVQTKFCDSVCENSRYLQKIEHITLKVIKSICETSTGSITAETVKSFIKQLIASYYSKNITGCTEIDSIWDEKDRISFYYCGNVYAQTPQTYSNTPFRIIISVNGTAYDEERQRFVAYITKQLLPVEQIMQYMITSAEKERKRKIRKKQNDQQLSLDMLAYL